MKKSMVLVMLLGLCGNAFAHIWWYGDQSDRWDNPANWSTGAVPTGDGTSEAALVDNSATNPTILIDAATAAVCNRLYIGDGVGDSRLYTLNMTGGTLDAITGPAHIYIGNWSISQAEFNLSGGVVTTSDVVLGNDPDGDAGPSGWLNMDGGEINYDHLFSLAAFSGTYGELNMTGGKITYTHDVLWAASGMLVGDVGQGVLNMTGGEIDLGIGTLFCPWTATRARKSIWTAA